MIERSAALFRNREANCAQAVAQAWCEKTSQNAPDLDQLQKCGQGLAPEGTCGALYAAKLIAGAERATQVVTRFAAVSGGVTACRDIRARRALSCLECVRTAAQALDEIMCLQQKESAN